MGIAFSALARSAPGEAPRLGILALDTRFPRIHGDVGNLDTWPFPTMLWRVDAATPRRVAGQRAEGLIDAFIEGGMALASAGAAGIATTCGFLAMHQPVLAARLPVPVATSALAMIPSVQALLPAGRRVGVITYSRAFLNAAHFTAVGAPADTPVEGVPPDGAMFRVITDGAEHFDPADFEAEVVAAGRRLLAAHPKVGAIVVECANMPPYSLALRRALRLPVFDAYGFIRWFYASLHPVVMPTARGRSFERIDMTHV